MKKKGLVIIFISVIILSIRLFCGVYTHDEFHEKHLFIKYKPTWKWTFFSPIGMSDTKVEELSKEEQIEQKYFNEFVRDQDLSR